MSRDLSDLPHRSPEISVPRHQWPADIVLVNEIELDRIRQRAAKPTEPEDIPPTGLMDRVRWVWRVIEREAPDIIQRAERFLEASGPEKKTAVVGWLNRLVDVLEATVDIPVVPSALEGMVWRLVRRRIPGIVQAVFDRMKGEGALA